MTIFSIGAYKICVVAFWKLKARENALGAHYSTRVFKKMTEDPTVLLYTRRLKRTSFAEQENLPKRGCVQRWASNASDVPGMYGNEHVQSLKRTIKIKS